MAEKLTAEFIGTLTLIFIGAGSIVVAGANGFDILGIAIAHGLAIGVMVSAVGHISGGHFNPAVTLGAWITQKIKTKDAAAYWIVQAAGGVGGAALLKVALPKVLTEPVRLGVPQLAPQISTGQGVLIEAILTFFLVWVIFATAIDPEGAFGKIAGLAIGFTITLDILMGGAWTGAAMNPARFLGPALIGGHWDHWYIWFVGPAAGGIIAAALYDGLMIRRPGSAAREEVAHGFGAHGDDAPVP
jgi:aquaporin Z